MKKITRIESSIPIIKRRKKVAAYARVSTSAERLKHSLSAQISYYSAMIQANTEWEFVRVYADEYISGTGTAKRTEFQNMIKDCEEGKIDIILTKSISRFARNTIDLLENIRHLKDLGIAVIFEKENINSMSGDGELMLTILASYAQEEVRSISDNIKWRMRKSMKMGKPNAVTSFHILGYEWENDTLVIVPKEADIVRRIFREYKSGNSLYKIAKGLNADGISTKRGYQWDSTAIQRILKNITYTGNILHQKQYVVDPISKVRKNNHGELPQYYVENDAIIDKSEFDYVQKMMKERGIQKPWMCHQSGIDFFRSKIVCKKCGCKFWHQVGHKEHKNVHYWRHSTYKSKDICIRGQINHNSLLKITADICGLEKYDTSVFSENIEEVYVLESNSLEFHLSDGRIITRDFINTGRADYWTPEHRAKLSAIRQDISYAKNKSAFTSKIKCVVCQCNFVRAKQIGKHSPNGIYYYWRCKIHGQKCMAVGLRDDILKEIISHIMKTDYFDESLFLQTIDCIAVNEQGILECHYKDGQVIETLYEHTSINPNLRWNKERKQKQSCLIKKYHQGDEESD